MPLDLTDDKSTLVQVMAWCRQAKTNVDPDLCRHMASLGLNELKCWACWALNNMTAFCRYFQMHFFKEKFCILIQISLKYIPGGPTDHKSALVEVMMARCSQAISHCLNQCWPRYVSLYGITGPQWVKRVGGHIFHQLGPNLQISCTNFTKIIGYQCSSPSNGHQVAYHPATDPQNNKRFTHFTTALNVYPSIFFLLRALSISHGHLLLNPPKDTA